MNRGKRSIAKKISLLCLLLLSIVFPITSNATNFSINRIVSTKTIMSGTHNWTILENTEFTYPTDKHIVIYVSLYNNRSEYKIKVHWFAPNGQLFKTIHKDMNQSNDRLKTYYNNFILKTEEIKNQPGQWKAHVIIDGEFAKTCTFTLKSNELPKTTPPVQSKVSPPITIPQKSGKEKAKDLYEEGNTHFESANYQMAVDKYSRAIELESRFAPLYYNLGQAQLEIGDKSAAAKSFQKYLDLRPSAANAAEVKALIKRLQGASGEKK